MDVREKLVELLGNIYLPIMAGPDVIGEYRIPYKLKEEIADHLIANGVTMDVREKTTGLNYEAEYNRLKEKMAKQNEENTYLLEELKEKEGGLLHHQGF